MAALAALAKKVWSARRLLVLLLAPLALLPILFALPPKVRWPQVETPSALSLPPLGAPIPFPFSLPCLSLVLLSPSSRLLPTSKGILKFEL